MSKPKDSTHADHEEISIETLSTPPTKILPAPFTLRAAACAIDSLLIAALYILLAVAALGFARPWEMAKPADVVYLAVLSFAYYSLQEGPFAATIGKRIMKLQIVDREGDPCSLSSSLIRNVLRFLDWLPIFYIAGGIVMLISRRRQRIGDRVAGTVVVKAPEKDINPPPAPFLFH